MYCRICGTEDNVKYYHNLLQSVCRGCGKGMPDKVSREEFYLQYWGENYQEVLSAIRKEFYEDYLHSSDDVESYIKGTVSSV